MRSSSSLLAALLFGAVSASSAPSSAHFVLDAPRAMTEQNGLGDPQKAPPCGDPGNAVPTGARESFVAGSKIRISINETIFHPGHYRVALALNDPSELPAEPIVTPGTTDCGSAPIDPNPVFPVLADGMLLHDERFDGPQSFEVTLPEDVTCENCTLQIIEFMSNHGLNNPGGCYYHHCANIEITPAGEPGGHDAGAGDGDLDAGTSQPGDGEPAAGDGNADADGTASDGASADGDAADGSDGRPGSTGKTSGGCAVGRSSAGPLGLLAVGLVGWLVRRRRR